MSFRGVRHCSSEKGSWSKPQIKPYIHFCLAISTIDCGGGGGGGGGNTIEYNDVKYWRIGC